MGDIRFTPTFHHVDWVDEADRVRAGEPNGFNARFNAIESDLQQLSTVVAQIDAALDDRTGQPSVQRLNLPPVFMRIGSDVWGISDSLEAFVVAGKAADGLLEVGIPHGVRLVSFRAIGKATGMTVAANLSRVAVGGTADPEVIASLAVNTNPFDRRVIIDPAFSPTAPGTFRYIIRASAPIPPTGADGRLELFQIEYAAA